VPRRTNAETAYKFIKHTPQIAFDKDTWVTTATEDVEVSGVMPDQAEAVFDAADPRSWDYYAKDVFESTQVGSWDANLQKLLREVAERPRPRSRNSPRPGGASLR
jgi:hypothetical protein